VSAIPLFFAYFFFRWLGVRQAGEALVRALESDSPNTTQRQMVAGILLVRSGRRALRILEDALRAGCASPMLIRVAGDTRLAELRPLLEPYRESADPAVARAAREALGPV
jgi:hypothetical protein